MWSIIQWAESPLASMALAHPWWDLRKCQTSRFSPALIRHWPRNTRTRSQRGCCITICEEDFDKWGSTEVKARPFSYQRSRKPYKPISLNCEVLACHKRCASTHIVSRQDQSRNLPSCAGSCQVAFYSSFSSSFKEKPFLRNIH